MAEAVTSAKPADDAAAVDVAAASVTVSTSAPAEGSAPAVPIETDELATPQSPPATADAAVATVADVTPTDADVGNFAASATPILALNDQPMEDTPAEEEQTIQASPSAAVEEVVMAESGAAGGAGDMATDEVAKDDPAAMEVDDTSQEVMDQ